MYRRCPRSPHLSQPLRPWLISTLGRCAGRAGKGSSGARSPVLKTRVPSVSPRRAGASLVATGPVGHGDSRTLRALGVNGSAIQERSPIIGGRPADRPLYWPKRSALELNCFGLQSMFEIGEVGIEAMPQLLDDNY